MLITIIAIISAVIMIYLTATLDSEKNITVNDIIAWLLAITLFIVMVKSDAIFANDINEAYNNGFNTAIQAAELVEVNEECYHIAFGNEIHCYER